MLTPYLNKEFLEKLMISDEENCALLTTNFIVAII
jgi:hypothetical protein